jgi:hypothetical protein
MSVENSTMPGNGESTKRWRITIRDSLLGMSGICVSLALSLAFVASQNRVLNLLFAVSACLIFGFTSGFMISRLLRGHTSEVLVVTLVSGFVFAALILLAACDYGPFP